MGQKEWGKKEKKQKDNWHIGELTACTAFLNGNFTRLFVSQMSVNRNNENDNKVSCDSKSSSLLVLVD